MPRKPSPCGTEAAYKRHLRHKEAPCDACRKAHRDLQREKRKPVVIRPAPVAVEPGETRLEALERQRELLSQAMKVAAEVDPKVLAPISRELRAVWAEIAELSEDSASDRGADPIEQLAVGLSVVPTIA